MTTNLPNKYPLSAAMKNRITRRHYIDLALMLMREGGHFGKPENDGKFSVIKKYVRYEEFCSKFC